MALIACKECNKEISSEAKACPSCGAKVPHTKWWLWIPLSLGVAFLGYGFSIPEWEARAREERKACEEFVRQLGGTQRQCDTIYENAIRRGGK